MRHPKPPRRTGLGLLLLALLAACAPAPVPTPAPPTAVVTAEPVTITFGAFDNARPVYEPIIAEFNAANSDVQVQFVSLDAIETSEDGQPTERALASAADTRVTWNLAPHRIDTSFVRDLTPFIAADPGFAAGDFYPGAIETDAAGRVALLPTALFLPLLMYNRELWDERGVPRPSAAWSWADLRAAATQLARRAGDTIDTYGVMLDTRFDLVAAADLHSLGPLLDADPAAIDLSDPAVVSAVDEIVGLVRAGVVFTPPEYPDGSFLNTDDYMPLIRDGRIGIWRLEHLRLRDGESLPFTPGIAAVPASSLDWRGVSRQGVVMSAGTRYPEQAWRWMAFLSRFSSFEPGRRGVEAMHPRRSVLETSAAWAVLDEDERQVVNVLLAQLAAGQLRNPAGSDASAWLVPDAIAEAVAAVLDQGETPEAALAAAQATLDAAVAAAAQPTATPDPAPLAVATVQPTPVVSAAAIRIVFGTASGDTAAMERAAERFNAQFPDYAVTIRSLGGSSGWSLSDLAASGDCFDSWTAPANDAERALLLDLQPLLDADPRFPRDDYPPALLEQFQHAGGLYGLPEAVLPRVLYYNKALFDAAGLDYPNAAWTLDDFVAAAERLTGGEGDERRYGFATLSSDDLIFFLARSGVSAYMGPPATAAPNFTSPDVEAAVGAYVALLRAATPGMPRDFERGSRNNPALDLALQGRGAMWTGFGLSDRVFGVSTGLPVRNAPIPLGAQALSTTDVIPVGLFISASTQYPEACWAWLRFLGDDAARLTNTLPARVSLAQAPAWLNQVPDGAVALFDAYSAALASGLAQTTPLQRGDLEYYWLKRATARAFEGADLGRELADAQFFTEQYQACVRGGERPTICARQVDPTYDGWFRE